MSAKLCNYDFCWSFVKLIWTYALGVLCLLRRLRVHTSLVNVGGSSLLWLSVGLSSERWHEPFLPCNMYICLDTQLTSPLFHSWRPNHVFVSVFVLYFDRCSSEMKGAFFCLCMWMWTACARDVDLRCLLKKPCWCLPGHHPGVVTVSLFQILYWSNVWLPRLHDILIYFLTILGFKTS